MQESTCWTLIYDAAQGAIEGREEFFRRYDKPVRAYLHARWSTGSLRDLIDDAVQQVFLECFRQGGALERIDPDRSGGFRAFLYGVVRNVARSLERTSARHQTSADAQALHEIAGNDSSLSRVFDRAWATALVKEAARLQLQRAEGLGERARRRVDLLHLRFHDGLPIREIAKKWELPAEHLHREYAKARDEFHRALREVVAFHFTGSEAELDEQCRTLLELLK